MAWLMLIWLSLCSLSTGINDVTNITVFMADDKEAGLGHTLYLWLWFNFTIYEYSIDNPQKGVTYSSASSGAFSTLGASDCPKPQDNNTAETKIMIENNNAEYVFIEKVSFHTASGVWYGIDAICMTQQIVDLLKKTPFSHVVIAESGCSSGQAVKWICVDNRKTIESCSQGDYKLIADFDITRPNQFISNAAFIRGNSLLPPEPKTCDPTDSPTAFPTVFSLTSNPTISPEQNTVDPTTFYPTMNPTFGPTTNPTFDPTITPTFLPTLNPSSAPSSQPTLVPTLMPSMVPTHPATFQPTRSPTMQPEESTISPILEIEPTIAPTMHLPSKPATHPTIVANSKKDRFTTQTESTKEKESWITSTVADTAEDAPESSLDIAVLSLVIAIVVLVVILAVCVRKSIADKKPKKPHAIFMDDKAPIEDIVPGANGNAVPLRGSLGERQRIRIWSQSDVFDGTDEFNEMNITGERDLDGDACHQEEGNVVVATSTPGNEDMDNDDGLEAPHGETRGNEECTDLDVDNIMVETKGNERIRDGEFVIGGNED